MSIHHRRKRNATDLKQQRNKIIFNQSSFNKILYPPNVRTSGVNSKVTGKQDCGPVHCLCAPRLERAAGIYKRHYLYTKCQWVKIEMLENLMISAAGIRLRNKQLSNSSTNTGWRISCTKATFVIILLKFDFFPLASSKTRMAFCT